MPRARIRLNAFSPKEEFITWEAHETLEGVYERVLEDKKIPKNLESHFKVFVDGYEVDKKFWHLTKAKPHTNLMIAVIPRGGGDSSSIFRLALTVAAVAAVTYFTGGLGTGFGAGVLKAGLSIGAVLLVNALIPPPSLNNSFNEQKSLSGSQTYSISSQSNQTNLYGNVLKVYGTHKVFPTVAANPYTTIEPDPTTGELVQFFHAIYDFGLGPSVVSNLKIGDTLLSEYNDVSFNFVDLNKPAVSEGVWDDALINNFEIYKNDIEQVSVSVALNSNQNDTGASLVNYQATRNAATNSDGLKQNINATVAFPSGLTSFGANGNQARVIVDVKLEFAEVGTEDWKNFDDLDFVEDFVELQPGFGTSFDANTVPNGARLFLPTNTDVFTELVTVQTFTSWNTNDYFIDPTFLYPDGITYPQRTYYSNTLNLFGIDLTINDTIPLTKELPVGSFVYSGGKVLGEVLSTSIRPAGGFYHKLSVSEPIRTVRLGYYANRVNNGTGTQPDATSSVTRYSTSFGNNATSVLSSNLSTNGVNRYQGNSQSTLYGTFSFTPKTTNSVKLRMTRQSTSIGEPFRSFDDMTWVDIVTKFDRVPVATDKRHVFLEIKIKATDQLNGSISNLSGECSSVLDVWTGSDWEKQITNNPAWIFADLMTGEINKRALSKTRLDTDSLLEWANFCDEVPNTPPNVETYVNPRFSANYILDYAVVLSDALNSLTTAAQASLNVIDGKYGVLIDRAVTTPVQVFTPRNSSGFSSTRNYVTPPDALKIRFIDLESDYEQKEKIVYSDGFDENTATTFEELDAFAVTNQEQAFRYGRYMLAQAKLRQENIRLTVDFEHLVCTRGDFVLITQDVMKVGGTPARVLAVSGNTVTIDTSFATTPLTSYGYTFRSITGDITTSTMTITSSTTADVNGDIPSVGDLIVWGEVDKITFECIVKSIRPNSDLTAELILTEKNNAIFDAESTENIPDYDPQISSVQDVNLTPPAEVQNLAVVENLFDCDGSQYFYYVDLTWSAPTNAVFETFEIYVNNGTGFNLDGFTQQTTYRHIVDQNFLGSEHSFKVLAVSATGSKLTLGEVSAVTATPVSKTTPPSDIDGLFINITNETLSLDWEPIEDCDVSFYSIRYSPDTTAAWEQSIELLRTSANTSLASVMARTGAYFVKAIDFNGNESENAASAITSIPNLFNLNIVEETNDFPTFPGSLERVQAVGSELRLSEVVIGSTFESDGFYYYENFLDLGDVYTVRLQSLIQAEGYTYGDIMSNWVTLDSVPFLQNTAVAQWNVETYYRARNSAFAMSNWASLDVIDPISEGEVDEWTDWRKFTIGDFTGRIFQFRLRLVSNQADVSPRVFDAVIRSDMPDRIYSDDNIVSSISGTTVTYSPAFYGPNTTPAIQITQDNAQTGDYYTISNKTLESFDITFYDSTNTAVSRQFDVLVKGYGYKFTTTI